MTRPKLLGVLLKAIGVWSFVGGIAWLPQAVSFLHRYPDEQAFLLMMADTFATPVIFILGAWLLIRRTEWFVGIAYPQSNPTADDATDDESARELFGVIVKAIGYWEIFTSVARFPYEAAHAYRSLVPGLASGLGRSGISIVAGCFLVSATDWIVRFAYRKPVALEDDDTPDEAPPESAEA